MKNKILEKKNIGLLEEIRKKNKIVLCHGVFDAFHFGHINHFKKAKKFGDILVVSITDDKFVNKGPGRPIFNSNIRSNLLTNLEIVDYVIISKDYSSLGVLKLVKPNIYAKDVEYQNKKNIFNKTFEIEKKYLKKIKCKLVFTKEPRYSSTSLINAKYITFNSDQLKFIDQIKKRFAFNDIQKLIDKLHNLKLTIVGDSIIDDYIFCQTEGISSKSPTLASVYKYKESYKGGALAVAEMASSLGSKVNLISYSSNTKKNNQIVKSLNKKIKFINVKNLSIPEIHRIVDIGRFDKLHQMYYFDKFRFDEQTFNKLKKSLEKYYSERNLLLAIDFGFGFFDKKFLTLLTKYNYAVNTHKNSINKYSNLISRYKKKNYFSINLREYLYDRRIDYTSNEKELIKNIKKFEKEKNFSITLGKNGSIIVSGSKVIKCPAFFTKIVDTTGSGDAYFLITSILNKLKIDSELVAFIGNIYAGLHANTIGNKKFVSSDDLLKNIKYICNFN